MTTSNEKEFKVGDAVWDSINHGKGKVKVFKEDDRYGLGVEFKGVDGLIWYTADGKYSADDLLPSLYHQPYTITLQEIPEELPEVGTPVYVWDKLDNWQFVYKTI